MKENKQSEAVLNKVVSPHKLFNSIEIEDCTWTEGFWGDKLKTFQNAMIPYMGEVLCGEVGHALNNFKIAAGIKEGEHQGMFWHDGDFYKFMEAKVFAYSQTKDKKLLQELDEYISIIAKAQEADGYIQTQIQLRDGVDRYENRKYHEMYNTGHLLISACIHFKITGQTNFLDIAIKQADLMCTIFMPETKHYGRFGFNQTQIMGLVELYRVTKNQDYLKLAEKFINRRGTFEVVHNSTTEGYPIGDMVQERTSLRESSEAVGHAVLALYYYAGAADVYTETGEKSLLHALDKLWDNITKKKMYVTGAVGQAHFGASTNLDMIEEGFIDEYMMPNMTAYNETCANLCNAMFSYRLLGIHGESKYADIIELVLFNSGLSGISVEGKDYFYSNPLRMIHNTRDYQAHENVTETPNRQPYLDCFCCPPNLIRTLGKLSSWAYSITENGLSVNLFGGNELNTKLNDGSAIRLKQDTEYPWKGLVKLTIEECKEDVFDIFVRIPEWANNTTLKVNDELFTNESGKYVKITRAWQVGDTIILDMPMETRLVEGHPRIEEVRNQIAVKRGPVVYCVETPDLPSGTEILDVYFDANSILEDHYDENFLGGVTTITVDLLIRSDKSTEMYNYIKRPEWQKYSTRLVPYFAWNNRGMAEMTVFMPIIWNNYN